MAICALRALVLVALLASVAADSNLRGFPSVVGSAVDAIYWATAENARCYEEAIELRDGTYYLINTTFVADIYAKLSCTAPRPKYKWNSLGCVNNLCTLEVSEQECCCWNSVSTGPPFSCDVSTPVSTPPPALAPKGLPTAPKPGDIGTFCRNNDDCWVKNCINSTCHPSPVGGMCLENSECESPATCYTLPGSKWPSCVLGAAQSCKNLSDCLSGNCDNGVCRRSNLTGPCFLDADCVSNLCSLLPEDFQRTCQSSPSPSGGRSVAYGKPCQGNSDCQSGICSDRADDGRFFIYHVCECTTDDCGNDTCFEGMCKRPAYANCEYGKQCFSRACQGFPTTHCWPSSAGQGCGRDTDCMSSDCNSTAHRCKPGLIGKPCYSTLDCVQGFTCEPMDPDNSVCKAPPDYSCTQNWECQSGYCASFSTPAHPESSSICAIPNQCMSACTKDQCIGKLAQNWNTIGTSSGNCQLRSAICSVEGLYDCFTSISVSEIPKQIQSQWEQIAVVLHTLTTKSQCDTKC